ncbi:unnamed protein product [Pleuronectes platessa]|uniref:Uncharacterized protein n=1 Tax=Pleuronectes platessa TaxID=8262 RepID=A0A9N7U9V6_PLEPL|nr:unnamed protein product [Pleuronectes platessa]
MFLVPRSVWKNNTHLNSEFNALLRELVAIQSVLSERCSVLRPPLAEQRTRDSNHQQLPLHIPAVYSPSLPSFPSSFLPSFLLALSSHHRRTAGQLRRQSMLGLGAALGLKRKRERERQRGEAKREEGARVHDGSGRAGRYKESPVGSHRPPVSVASCPLLRLHTISQSLTAGVTAPRTIPVFALQLSLWSKDGGLQPACVHTVITGRLDGRLRPC